MVLYSHLLADFCDNILHVPSITKNLISVGQIVEQGMQVRFNNDGCFIERGDQVIAHDRREGYMFIFSSTEVKLAMFAKGLKVKSDLHFQRSGIWAKGSRMLYIQVYGGRPR